MGNYLKGQMGNCFERQPREQSKLEPLVPDFEFPDVSPAPLRVRIVDDRPPSGVYSYDANGDYDEKCDYDEVSQGQTFVVNGDANAFGIRDGFKYAQILEPGIERIERWKANGSALCLSCVGPLASVLAEGECWIGHTDAEAYDHLRKHFVSRATDGQMHNIDDDVAVLASGPGKSPPVFNLILDMARLHRVAVAMVFKPGYDAATSTSLSWEAGYGLNLGLALGKGKKMLVILHDDKVIGHVQRLEMNIMDKRGIEYQMLTVRQFLETYCKTSKANNGWESNGEGVWYYDDGVRAEGSSTHKAVLEADGTWSLHPVARVQ